MNKKYFKEKLGQTNVTLDDSSVEEKVVDSRLCDGMKTVM